MLCPVHTREEQSSQPSPAVRPAAHSSSLQAPVLHFPRARALAVASATRSVLVIVPVAGGGGGGVTVKPAVGLEEGRISAVEWVLLTTEDGEGEGVAVAVGTDTGWLLFYSLAGDLLHKQVT